MKFFTDFRPDPFRPFVVEWTNPNGWASYTRFADEGQAREIMAGLERDGATAVTLHEDRRPEIADDAE